jgi:predicted DNA-binding protein
MPKKSQGRPEVKMKKFPMYLPVNVLKNLEALSDKTGAPVAEIVRRAVARYLISEHRTEDHEL